MKTFQDLLVWKKAHEITLDIYRTSRGFPQDEKFGMMSQIRRSASSIPTNIVEGFKRKSQKDFAHFLNVADVFLEETKYHLILARDLEYLSRTDYKRLCGSCDEVGRMLCGLQKKVAGNVSEK